MSIVSSKQ